MLIAIKKLYCFMFHDAIYDSKGEFRCLECNLHIRECITTYELPQELPKRPDFEALFSSEE